MKICQRLKRIWLRIYGENNDLPQARSIADIFYVFLIKFQAACFNTKYSTRESDNIIYFTLSKAL